MITAIVSFFSIQTHKYGQLDIVPIPSPNLLHICYIVYEWRFVAEKVKKFFNMQKTQRNYHTKAITHRKRGDQRFVPAGWLKW